MGATLIGARFSERKQRAFIGHVGDSRCYRLRGGELRLLTEDHTLARYGVSGTLGKRIRRALGLGDQLSVDVVIDKPMAGDVYVLCSDGLNKMLDDAGIARIISESADDLDRAVHALIDAANEAGGKDNVSVILVGVRSPEPRESGYCRASS
jgi:protein phosphatase